MNENEMLQTILNEIKGMNGEIKALRADVEGLKDGQKAMNGRLDNLEKGQRALEDVQKAIRSDVEDLKDGQKLLEEGIGGVRRDVARVERKLDKQGNDIADALWYLSNNVDQELDKLKQAK